MGTIEQIIKETIINLPADEANKYLAMWKDFARGIETVGAPGSDMESPQKQQTVLEGATALLGRHHTNEELMEKDRQAAKKMWDALNREFHFNE